MNRDNMSIYVEGATNYDPSTVAPSTALRWAAADNFKSLRVVVMENGIPRSYRGSQAAHVLRRMP